VALGDNGEGTTDANNAHKHGRGASRHGQGPWHGRA
jgi:hypothetical protein